MHEVPPTLLHELRSRSATLDVDDDWPAAQLQCCADAGVFAWFVDKDWGGQQLDDAELAAAYVELAAACLTTTFVITQRTAACHRIAASSNDALRRRLLPDLVSGRSFATVGISHLTTSRRHVAPVLRAEPTPHGFLLDGYTPWVTGCDRADTLVVGAVLPDGHHQVLLAVDARSPGLAIGPPARLVGLNASRTGPVQCRQVAVDEGGLIAGPSSHVMALGTGTRTGGWQTSALAVGLAQAAIEGLEHEAVQRTDLAAPAAALRGDWRQLRSDLFAAAGGEPTCGNEVLRARANSLALRASQAALAAAKGAGYVDGHPAGRWCRESLFFLVWSCPQPVMAANLCELAGL